MSSDTRTKGTTRLLERRTVSKPQEEVFAYTADFSNIDQWDPGIAQSTEMTDGALGVGTKYQLEVRVGPGSTPMIYEIVTFDPPHRVVLVGTGRRLHAVDDIRFAADGSDTVIEYTADLTFIGLPRLLTPLMRPALRRIGRRALDGLAKVLGQ